MPLSTTLKQKLSNLALSQSTPNTPLSSPSASTRRLPFNFARRTNQDNDPSYEQYSSGTGDESLDEIMQRVIRQAGVDYETRPMVVITAAEFPDPKHLSYDRLFERVLLTLDLYVESDYTVVFLVAGGKFQPGWSWVWKSYRSLNRKYRKNLKKLYIVHTTVFSKMLFSLAGTIISPKFFRKIQYIPTLSALATCVPLTNLDLHPAVYKENLKHERQIVLPPQYNTRSQMFGVPLERLMGDEGQSSGIPRAVKDCVEDIRARGLEMEGLFRRSPNSAMLRHAKEAYDRGQPVSLSSFGDPHISAVLLKKFFRDLPKPVFPETMYPAIQACPPPSTDPSDRSCIDYIRDSVLPLVENTSPATLIVLSYVLHLLHDISIRSSINLMDATNLALCFSPNLVAGTSIIRDTQFCSIPDISLTTQSFASPPPSSALAHPMTLGILIRVCIDQYFEIFEELPDRTTATSSHPSLSFSNSHSTVTTSSSLFTPSPSALLESSASYGATKLSTNERPLSRDRHLQTPIRQNHTSGPISPLSPESSESFTTAEDSDSDPDEAMLIMPLGPSSPPTSPPSAWSTASSPIRSSATPNRSGGMVGHPSSPLSHGQTHRRKGSGLSGGSSASARGAAQSTFEGGDRRSSNGTLRNARSIVTIDRTVSGSGSIRLGGRGTRRVSGSGVEAIGVTASGFFSPVNGEEEEERKFRGLNSPSKAFSDGH